MDMLGGCRLPNSNLMLPPGFRFHPSDEELIVHYLRNKATCRPIPASIIAEIDLYKYNPWDLPAMASFGEDEWYFFSPRDRKYPNGSRPNRAAASGFWKATGTDKPILTCHGSQRVGVKKALVFYKGRPPKGDKTDWVMHEYRLLDTMARPARSRGSMRLDDWVLCRVRRKSNHLKTMGEDHGESSSEAIGTIPEVDEHFMNSCLNNSNVLDNYLQKECPTLALILASQNLSFDVNSNISFQAKVNTSNTKSMLEPFLNQGNSPMFISSTESTPGDEYQEYAGLIPSTKNLTTNMNSNFSNFYDQYQPQDTIFTQNLYNPTTEFQPLKPTTNFREHFVKKGGQNSLSQFEFHY